MVHLDGFFLLHIFCSPRLSNGLGLFLGYVLSIIFTPGAGSIFSNYELKAFSVEDLVYNDTSSAEPTTTPYIQPSVSSTESPTTTPPSHPITWQPTASTSTPTVAPPTVAPSSATGSLLSNYDVKVFAAGELLSHITGIWTDSNGYVWITDASLCSVFVFSETVSDNGNYSFALVHENAVGRSCQTAGTTFTNAMFNEPIGIWGDLWELCMLLNQQ